MLFPVISSCILMSLYYSIFYFGKSIVSAVLNSHFIFMGGYSIKSISETFVTEEQNNKFKVILFNKTFKGFGYDVQVFFDSIDFICLLVSASIMAFYIYTNHWIFNNIMAIMFSMYAI